jgi:hypothetical protein
LTCIGNICREDLTKRRRETIAGPAAAMGLGLMRTAGVGIQTVNVEAFLKADLHGTANESPEMKRQVRTILCVRFRMA